MTLFRRVSWFRIFYDGLSSRLSNFVRVDRETGRLFATLSYVRWSTRKGSDRYMRSSTAFVLRHFVAFCVVNAVVFGFSLETLELCKDLAVCFFFLLDPILFYWNDRWFLFQENWNPPNRHYSLFRSPRLKVSGRIKIIVYREVRFRIENSWDVENRPRHPGWGKPAGKPLKFECHDRTKYIRNSVCLTSVQSSFFLEMSSGFGNLWATVKILLANEILIDKIVEQYSTTKV